MHFLIFPFSSVVEYMENFVFPKTLKKFQPNWNRKEKWVAFFESPEGSELMVCISEKNRLWGKVIPQAYAERICGIVQAANDPNHASSHDINAGTDVCINKQTLGIQAFNVIICLAEKYGISINVV